MKQNTEIHHSGSENVSYTPWGLGQAYSVFWKTLKESFHNNEPLKRQQQATQHNWYLRQNVDAQNKLNAIVSGNGDKKWMFLHGTPAHARKWEWYLSHTPDTHQYISLDRPGFGLNKHETLNHSLQEQSKILSPWFDNDEEYILIGHSFGGALASQIALDYPRNIKGIVLLSASLDPKLEPLHPLQHIGRTFPFSSLLPRNIRHSNNELLELHNSLPKLQPRLSEIKAPILVIHARDDDLTSFANIEYYREHLKNTEFLQEELLDEGGHFIPWLQPEWVTEKISNFERRCHSL